MISKSMKIFIGSISIFACLSLSIADEIPQEKEEGRVLESMFIGSSSEAKIPSIAPELSSSITTKTSGFGSVMEVQKEASVHIERNTASTLGKGNSLTDNEIDRSLLLFTKELEIEKQKALEEKERLAKEAEEASSNKAESKSGIIAKNEISIDEQKERLNAGLSQFPEEDASSEILPKISEVVAEQIIFYGVSCINSNCVAITGGGIFKVGDVVAGDEKIVSVRKDKIVTTTRDIPLFSLSSTLGEGTVSEKPDGLVENSSGSEL